MARGTIAKLVRDRGFGFIRGNDGKDVFFHRSGISGGTFEDLEEGSPVDFEVEQTDKGLRAANVRVTSASGSTDSGSTDSGSTDSGPADSGSTDSGSTDSGSADSG